MDLDKSSKIVKTSASRDILWFVYVAAIDSDILI